MRGDGRARRAIGLDESLRVLVKLRASLVNGCVYCIDLHSREGFDAGERPERLFGLASWRESPFFDERERAALALTDRARLGMCVRSPHWSAILAV